MSTSGSSTIIHGERTMCKSENWWNLMRGRFKRFVSSWWCPLVPLVTHVIEQYVGLSEYFLKVLPQKEARMYASNQRYHILSSILRTTWHLYIWISLIALDLCSAITWLPSRKKDLSFTFCTLNWVICARDCETDSSRMTSQVTRMAVSCSELMWSYWVATCLMIKWSLAVKDTRVWEAAKMENVRHYTSIPTPLPGSCCLSSGTLPLGNSVVKTYNAYFLLCAKPAACVP
jgi:hypothetical protein